MTPARLALNRRGGLIVLVTLVSGCNSSSGPTAPSAADRGVPEYVVTPTPFGLTSSRTFDVLGWDYLPDGPAPSQVRFRWNAAAGTYEVLSPGSTAWSRLEAYLRIQYSTPSHYFDAFGTGGVKLPFGVSLPTAPHAPPAERRHAGVGTIFDAANEASVRASFAFGIATEPGDVPLSGTTTCRYGQEEGAQVVLTFDFAAGTFSALAEHFWRTDRFRPDATSYSPGATTFSARFGGDGMLEGRFFGPRAANITVRAKGGAEHPFSSANGVMVGLCE